MSTASPPDRIGLGTGLILASVAAMAFADALVKLASADLTLWQIFIVRSLFALPLLATLGHACGIALAPVSPKWSLARSALLVLTWIAYYASLPVLDLSVAAVAVYTNPILIAILSATLLGTPVTARQWLGIVLGFAGVLAILRPGTEAFSWAILLPLLGAALYALAMVLTRAKCQAEAPLALALNLHLTFLVTGLVAFAILSALPESDPSFLLSAWHPMATPDWALLALLGLLSAAYFMGVARAYQIAPPPIIATFDYAYLVWAAIWGIVLFAETPDAYTIAGMTQITCAGLLVSGSPIPRPASD